MRFPDRSDAGGALADTLHRAGVRPDVVLGLPRGGVPVAFEVAAVLAGIPLDVIVVRKLGVPFQPELAMGALGEGGVQVENPRCCGRRGSTSPPSIWWPTASARSSSAGPPSTGAAGPGSTSRTRGW